MPSTDDEPAHTFLRTLHLPEPCGVGSRGRCHDVSGRMVRFGLRLTQRTSAEFATFQRQSSLHDDCLFGEDRPHAACPPHQSSRVPARGILPVPIRSTGVRTEDIKADLLRRADGTLSASEAARMLGQDVVTLQALAAESVVIALPLPGGTAYPACQFEIGGMVAGLSEV